ncbi:50S ribosomal protein L1 [Candidatus Woesearchaeota archaeon]|nr:50S ribosomal protein L1 [Candidatus Woesearchaeota archaeon]
MEKSDVIKALQEIRKGEKKKFTQTIDLILNLKHLDLKKPEHQVELFIALPHGKGRDNTVCAFVGPELAEAAAAICDGNIQEKDFDTYARDKKAAKKLSDQYTYFIAQANIMPKVATAFGRVFGPRKKMPNPKAGCVVPPKVNLQPVIDKLRKTIKVIAKERPMIQVAVGSEAMSDDQVADNILLIYTQVLHKLPEERNNIKSVLVKTTMGKPAHLSF